MNSQTRICVDFNGAADGDRLWVPTAFRLVAGETVELFDEDGLTFNATVLKRERRGFVCLLGRLLRRGAGGINPTSYRMVVP